DGWVGLRVTDDHGRTGIGYARMTVTDANRPPVIATRTPDAPLLGVDVGGSLPFAVTAGDPDSDPVTDSWFVDNQPAGSGPTFTYAPTQVGVHVVRAEGSDNQPSGGRAVAEWTVGVRLPGADNPPPPPPRLDLAVAQVDT